MNNLFVLPIQSQFGASIQMLENAIIACPTEHWDTERKFWYNAFHCLFFTDYYLNMQPKDFTPPPPFSESEFEDRMPERVYSKEELLTYLRYNRVKLHELCANLNNDSLNNRWINTSGSMNYSVSEILLYNIRHVQHHVAQLNLILREVTGEAPDWVFQAE
jgi:DinB superfamily